MDADFEIELGADDEILEFPWRSEDGRLRYFDLKAQPDLILYIDEAREFPEIGEFLEAVNGRSSFVTAKCDVWEEHALNEAEKIYGGSMKVGSYVDILFGRETTREDFAAHEGLVRRICKLLGQVPELSAAVELDVRRCFSTEASHEGFYVTAYSFGYGDSRQEARKNWGIALKLLQNVILQVSGEIRGLSQQM